MDIELLKEVIRRLVRAGEIFAAELVCIDYGLNKEEIWKV